MPRIALRNRAGEVVAVALVDDADYSRLMARRWQFAEGYAQTQFTINGKRNTVLMHRFILGVTDPSIEVDHVNHDGLNNQRTNLRQVTKAQNQQNRRGAQSNSSTGIRGVHWDKSKRLFRAGLHLKGKTINLGQFTSLAEASVCVTDARKRFFTHSQEGQTR